MNVEEFVADYGSEMPEEEKILLRAAAAYYKSYYESQIKGTEDELLWSEGADFTVSLSDDGGRRKTKKR